MTLGHCGEVGFTDARATMKSSLIPTIGDSIPKLQGTANTQGKTSENQENFRARIAQIIRDRQTFRTVRSP
jgi:hypothetical protein